MPDGANPREGFSLPQCDGKPLVIGLISDTHVPVVTTKLPRGLWEVFEGVDLILHAGDIYDTSVLDELETIAPVLAALGDDDGDDAYNDPRVKERQELKLGGLTLWLTHKRYNYWDIGPGAAPSAEASSPNIIVFGHAHVAGTQTNQGVLVFNPGSATFPRYRKEPGTVGLLTIADGKATARHFQL